MNRILGALFGLGAVVALGLSFVQALAWQPDPPVNGDMLGQDSGESFEAYQQRAAESLAKADQPSFALITFSEPLTPKQAGKVTADLERVNAMIVEQAPPFSLAEPVDGAQRSDVYSAQLDNIAFELRGIGNVAAPETLSGIIAFDEGESLRALDGPIAAIEVLAPDAIWGTFGIRPVDPSTAQSA